MIYCQEIDTNWEYIYFCDHNTIDYPGQYWEDTSNRFLLIWPIIDTSSTPLPPECTVPGDFRALYTTPEVCLFTWAASNGADHYELAIGDPNLPPEAGTIYQCHDTYKPVNDLDTGCHYAAWIRTVCDSNRVSAWSDSIHFCVRNGGVGITTAADNYTQLYPNPAGDQVTVASSFRIGEVELFSLTGQRVAHQAVDGISATLDLTGLPAGTYLVRIATNHGIAVKKLVKQ